MNRILVVRGISAYDVLGRAADEVCKGFQNRGYEVDVIDAALEDRAERLWRALQRLDEYEFYFSFQAIYWEEEKKNLTQLQKMCRIGWLVDDPIYHTVRLVGSTGKNAHVIATQREHAERIKREYPYFDDVRVLYHGGFWNGFQAEWMGKDIDVFFSGTYTPLQEAEKKVEEIGGVFGSVAKVVKERIIGEGLNHVWTEELKKYLEELDFHVDEEEFQVLLEIMAPLEVCQRAWMRKAMIEELLKNGIQVSVVGSGWGKYEGEGKENLKILSNQGVEIDEAVRLMQRSKIVLHCINFFSGMHERIFTAMLANAVCVTCDYDLLHDFFEDGKEIITFSLTQMQELPIIVKNILENPDKAEQIADAGYQTALKKHTWERRGEQIVKQMQDKMGYVYY